MSWPESKNGDINGIYMYHLILYHIISYHLIYDIMLQMIHHYIICIKTEEFWSKTSESHDSRRLQFWFVSSWLAS